MNMNFKEFIKTDREKANTQKFEGSFLEYLDIVKEHPEIVQLAHKRLYNMIMDKGVEELKADENPRVRKIYGNEIIRKYGFFKDDFYGIDKVIMKLANYFKSAAKKGEEARQVLYLVGPVGAGKSVTILSNTSSTLRPVLAEIHGASCAGIPIISSISSLTSCGLALGKSILFITGKISKLLSIAKYTFAKVWASTPWLLSTTKIAPSHAAKLRETS